MSELITRNGGAMSSQNFMRLVKAALSDGIVDGCAITKSGNNINITAGHILAGGAFVEVNATTLTVSSDGEVILKIDTSAETPVSIIARTSAALTQQDLTNGGTVYELRLAAFTISSGSVNTLSGEARKARPIGYSYGTAAPSGGSSGDIYFKIVE